MKRLYIARLLRIASIVGMSLQAGCVVYIVPPRHGGVDPGHAHAPPGAPAGSATGFAPAATVAGVGPQGSAPGAVPPPQIGGPGAASESPPAAALPPPLSSEDRIAQLCKKYGIRSISGSNATPEELDKLDSAFSKLPPGLYSTLTIDYEPANASPEEVKNEAVRAYWKPTKADGSDLPKVGQLSEVAGGRMYLFRKSTKGWTIVHETAHHITKMSDQPFAKQLLGDLGYKRTDNEPKYDDHMTQQNWVAERLDDGTFPTDYSKSKWGEHLAELIAAYAYGPNEPDSKKLRQEFKGPGAAQGTLSARLGPGRL
jgi:hypothetical protein